jgi:carbonic anhydrase
MKVLIALALFAVVAAAQISFTYPDTTWGGICQTGKRQSPINIMRDQTVCVREGEFEGVRRKINFHYWPAHGLETVNTGHTLKVKSHVGFVTVGGCNPCDGQRYHLKQINFRTPAEHTIDASATRSGRYPLELHLVHQKEGATGLNDLLFIAIFFYQQLDGGFPNKFLHQLEIHHAPTTTGGKFKLSSWVNIFDSLKEALTGEYYTYDGSITTPTCDETVQWFVMKTPLGATKEQIASLNNIFNANNNGGNARGTKDLNGRRVYWYRKHN